MELDTARLRLRPRPLTDDDVDDVVALHTDPQVMRHLGPPVETTERVRGVLLPRFRDLDARMPGFGYAAAEERATGAFLGWFLFRAPRTDDPPPGEIELGYRLHRAAWGRGFATEGSRALVDRGFAELGVDRIMATTMAVNLGSRRVMEKIGLGYVAEFDEPLPGSEHGEVEYALTRAQWEGTQRERD